MEGNANIIDCCVDADWAGDIVGDIIVENLRQDIL